MSAKDVVLELEERTVLGKGLAKIRSEKMIPAVIHNHGKQSIHVQADYTLIAKAYQVAGKNHPLDLRVGDEKYYVLIKDVAYKTPKHTMQHVVFQSVKQNVKVEAEVPIEIIGNPPAERLGMNVLHQLDRVVVQAFPRDLPDHFEVDAEKLAELHDRITVADLIVPENVEIITEADHAIATVVEPRALAAEDAEEATEGEETTDGEPAPEAPAES